MSERVRDQALAPMECDIPAAQSVAEYRRARVAALARRSRLRPRRLPATK